MRPELSSQRPELSTQRPELRVRRIDFRFDPDIPFHFNPRNLGWSHFVNAMTMVAPAFERYFIRGIRDALPLVRDEQLRREADAFCKQEAQHSRHHQTHLQLLVDRFPALDDARQRIADSYRELYERESTEYHLAYAATVELFFGPTAKFIIENRVPLFRGGDPRITGFILWHFVEEFEHRNCAIDIYDDVVGRYGFRVKSAFRVLAHLRKMGETAGDALARVVSADVDLENSFEGTTKLRQLGLVWRLANTLTPWHRPDHLGQPDWVTQWLANDAAGRDQRVYQA